MSSQPVVSIITVCFNAEAHIRKTIESVIAQDYPSVEYIVIDGGSNDGTLDILKRFEKSITITVSEPDMGIYDAMNKGLTLATGDFILFINAGDMIDAPNVISECAKHPNADIIFSETNLINEVGEILGTRSELTTRKLPRELTKQSFLDGQVVSHQSFIVRRSIAPAFDLKYQCSADIDWMIKVIVNAKLIVRIDTTISQYLIGGESDRNLKTCWKERLEIMMRHFPYYKVLFAHLRFAFRYLIHGAYKTKAQVSS